VNDRLNERIKIRNWLVREFKAAVIAEKQTNVKYASLGLGLFLCRLDDSIKRRGGKIKDWRVKT
jgi:hypothetical protein